jgi:sigma-E factor negative regulatory protein RseA
VNQDERASQLSAMFDGELPAAECELLSRRLARDEQLRAAWSRYAVIGAALRAEPLAQVRPDFARRVSAALAGGVTRARRGRVLRGAALGSALAAGVAGVAIMLLRNGLPVQDEVLAEYTPTVQRVALARTAPAAGSVNERLGSAGGGNELGSYVVPPLSNDNSLAVPATLADYVVAHSEVSSSLARGNLLSALVGNEMVQPAPSTLLADGKR